MAALTHRRCRPLLGTFVEVAVARLDAAAVDHAFAAIAHVQAAMSFHDEASDLARLRRADAGTAVVVHPDTITVLRLAERLHRRTSGLFDVTVAPALVADGFLPRPADMAAARPGIGADAIEIVDDRTVRCHAPRLIDLGGIAKGFAVDRAIQALAEAGVAAALVNAGGDLRVLGDAPQPVHLRDADGAVEAMVMLADAALASSATTPARSRTHKRMATAHRGRGATSLGAGQAVSVLAPFCMLADAMTKVALADPELAREILGEEGGAIVARPLLRERGMATAAA